MTIIMGAAPGDRDGNNALILEDTLTEIRNNG